MKRNLLTVFFALVLALPCLFFLNGCKSDSGVTYVTTYPDEYKIVVRVDTGTIFCEETFIKSGNIYYYKYQSYNENFETIGGVMNQYIGIKDGAENYTTYSYNGSAWYENSSISFLNNWGLNLYCKAPSFAFQSDEKESDETVNGTECVVYTADGVTYKIAKSADHIVWQFWAQTSSGYICYEVQTISQTNVLSGISTTGLPTGN